MEVVDLDMDGLEDLRVWDRGQVVTIDPSDGGGIGGWDIRAVRHALTAVMRRRPEAYHETLRRHEAAALAGDGGGEGGAPASIHDRVMTKESGLSERLRYDDHERRSGLVRLLPLDAGASDWADVRVADLGDFLDHPFEIASWAEPGTVELVRDGKVVAGGAPQAVRVTRTLTLGGDRRSPALEQAMTIENRSDRPLRARLGSEWTMTMLGGGGNPSAWWDVGGVRTAHDGSGEAAGIGIIGQGNDYVGISVTTTVSPPADAWWAPVETISNSEGGFERVYQGSGLLLSWIIDLAPGESASSLVSHAVATTLDRAASST
jgi:alpha-amylase